MKDEVRARSVSKVNHNPCLRCGLGQNSSFILSNRTLAESIEVRYTKRRMKDEG